MNDTYLMEKWNVQRRASIFSWHPPPLPTPSWERLRELSTFVFRGETDIFGKWKMILEGTNRHGYHSPHN